MKIRCEHVDHLTETRQSRWVQSPREARIVGIGLVFVALVCRHAWIPSYWGSLLDESRHVEDIRKLLQVLQRLVDGGNTVVVIEDNLDVVKSVDHIIDLGPEGGSGGGRIIAQGTPEEVAQVGESYTGKFLREMVGTG